MPFKLLCELYVPSPGSVGLPNETYKSGLLIGIECVLAHMVLGMETVEGHDRQG